MSNHSKEREFNFTEEDFQFIVAQIKAYAGIKLADSKKGMVYSRVSRRVRELGLSNVKEYCNYLVDPSNSNEITHFVNAMTTNLTKFFREEHHFDHLKEVLQEYLEDPIFVRDKELKIWCAAASSGEEPYSIAMTVLDTIKDHKNWNIKILATDIDTSMLAKCSEGKYKIDSIEHIPEKYRKSFLNLKSTDNSFTVKDSLKNIIFFKQLNLHDAWPIKKKFHFVFCRNVVIYFDKDAQKILFDKMANLMMDDSYLYIGHSENLFNITKRFSLIGKTIYRKVK